MIEFRKSVNCFKEKDKRSNHFKLKTIYQQQHNNIDFIYIIIPKIY